MSSAANDRLKLLLPAFIVLIFSAALLASQGVVIKLFLHDSFITFDGMWRMSLGETPHIDFHTPVGQAYFWPVLLLGWLGGLSAMTIIHSHVVVGLFLAAAMTVLLPRRLTLLEMAISCTLILAMAMAPRDVDHATTDYSWLAPYNRWSWGLWMLSVQAMLIPPTAARHGRDGIVLGLLAGLMAYIKLSFFGMAVILALLAFVTGRLPRKTAWVAAGTLVAMAIMIELIWHNNMAYWADLRMAMLASAEGRYNPRILKIWSRLLISSGTWLAIPLIFRLASKPRPMREWLALWWQPMAIAFAALLGGMLVSIQNFPDLEFAHLVLAVLIAWQMARRERGAAGQPEAVSSMPSSRFSMGALILVLGWALIGSAKDVGSIVLHALKSRDGTACRIPALAGTRASDLMVPAYILADVPEDGPVPPCATAVPADPVPHDDGDDPVYYLRKLERVLTLVRAHIRPGDVILPMDFSNPYPFLFRAGSPHGAMLWMDMGRSYGEFAHPPARPLLHSSNLVIEIKNEDYSHPGHAWLVYGPDVARGFHIVGENETARLWRRNGS